MLLRNIYKTNAELVYKMHSGKGIIEFSRIFSSDSFETTVDFIDYSVIPPGSSIGYHQHMGNEEFYLILKGKGKMLVDDEEVNVKEGDLIINQDKSFHALENCSKDEIHIFVIQVSK